MFPELGISTGVETVTQQNTTQKLLYIALMLTQHNTLSPHVNTSSSKNEDASQTLITSLCVTREHHSSECSETLAKDFFLQTRSFILHQRNCQDSRNSLWLHKVVPHRNSGFSIFHSLCIISLSYL